jgi:DNA-binding NtrC family response regulator
MNGIERSKRRILIVDDEAPIKRLLAELFSNAGFDVRVASSADEAIGICESEPIDVLLSDIEMPGLNGYELVEALIARKPQMRAVLMSGFDRWHGADAAATLRYPFLAKPFRTADALRIVNGLYEQHRPAGAS